MNGANSWRCVLERCVATAALVLYFAAAGPTGRADPPPSNDAWHSKLWGQRGEHWDPAGRLPDFSYAGYRRGEHPLPDRDADVSVAEFGAVGDGKADDTDAFVRALREAGGKTIRVPAGTYVINGILEITHPQTVLQGAGSERTRMRMTEPLNEIEPNWGATTGGRRTSNYSWSGGFIRVNGALASESLADVSEPAARGGRELVLSDVGSLSPGDEVRLVMRDDGDQSLATHLYQDDPGRIDNLKPVRVSFVAKLTQVDPETNRVELDRHLATDVDPRWSPLLYRAESTVEEVGIEGIGFEFPKQPYEGHFTELGFNAIAMSGTRNCWIRDVQIHNCDSGIFLRGVNTTVTDLTFTSERPVESSRKATGHHGITLGGQDNLLSDFDFQTRFMHDITVTRGSSGNVAMGGRGVDLCFDHHRYAPHSNLFTDIDIGAGSRMFQSGGGAALGRHSAAWETFWGIRSRRPIAWPADWGPDIMNLVGVPSDRSAEHERDGRWFEPGDAERLQPSNLYEAQLARRLRKQDIQNPPSTHSE